LDVQEPVAPMESLSADFAALPSARPQLTAPHFVSRVASQVGGESAIRTTLDAQLQQVLERRISGYIATNSRLGVHNASAMLIDSRTMEVLAEVGSANFFDESIDGQVNGTRSRRSPGSTLKPFIYALAMDQGLLHPLTMLTDAPRSFGSYNPENFDGEFAGPIKAAEALARSRNLPAVTVAAQLAHPTFYEFLKRGGVELPHDESFYGLSLPLGGGEVTMEELVRLYAALANGGRLRPLQRIRSESAVKFGTRLFSPEAAFLTLQMLGQVPVPGANQAAGDAGVYWKTGTSHGFRDAWSVAVFDRYVLAVWVGNFDGRRNATFIGRTCAGPLLFHIIDAIRSERRGVLAHREPPDGANLRQVEFCAVSGRLPSGCCEQRVNGWFIPGVSPIATCEIHREVLLDAATGLRLSADDGTRGVRREVFEFWPSDLQALFEKAGLPRRQPPPFLPGEGAGLELLARSGKAPEIVSPQPNHVYAIRAGDDSNRTISLKAQADAGVAKLYWFADKAFLGSVPAREALQWQPSPGRYQVVALDDHGRSSSCRMSLQLAENR
jgi:penicillin-binding protein 1C